jgi:hypothetical protein
MRLSRVRFKVRRMMVAMAVTAAACLLTGALWGIDALARGPHATAFNRRCQRLAHRARLVGRPEAEVVKVLASPREVWRYWSAALRSAD